MLSLVLGSEISDASVAAIASSYSNLELLDLSGYVSGLGAGTFMIVEYGVENFNCLSSIFLAT